MAPYNFQAADADAILRCSDGNELRVHKVILSFASSVFHDMLDAFHPSELLIPVLDIPESSTIFKLFIQYLYPSSVPKVSDVNTWAGLYATAVKYNAEVVAESLRGILIPQFLETSPLRVYALASHWGFEEEAEIASRRTLEMDISNGFPEEDVRLMGSIACQRLYLLHIKSSYGLTVIEDGASLASSSTIQDRICSPQAVMTIGMKAETGCQQVATGATVQRLNNSVRENLQDKVHKLEMRVAVLTRDKAAAEQTAAAIREERDRLISQQGPLGEMRRAVEQIQLLVTQANQTQQRTAEWVRQTREAGAEIDTVRSELRRTKDSKMQLDSEIASLKLQLEERDAYESLAQDHENELRNQVAFLEEQIRRLTFEASQSYFAASTPPANGHNIFEKPLFGNKVRKAKFSTMF